MVTNTVMRAIKHGGQRGQRRRVLSAYRARCKQSL